MLVHILPAAQDAERPIWISAEAATKADGSVDWDLLGDDFRRNYENLKTWPSAVIEIGKDGVVYDRWVSHPRPGGVYWGPTHRDAIGRPADETIDDLVRNARYIVQGRVVASQVGFFDSEPATLLTLHVRHMARPEKNARTEASEFLRIAYPYAEFRIGEHGFLKGDPSYPPVPSVGDRVLFFDFTVALDADRTVFRPEADKILVSSGDQPYRELPTELVELISRMGL